MNATAATHRFDNITISQLRAAGASKWADPAQIGAFVAEMDFGTAHPITAALQAAVTEGAFGYTPQKYRQALQETVSHRLNTVHNWHTSPADVHAVPDVLAALELVLEHFVPQGKKVIVTTPAYMPFMKIPGFKGREIIEVPLKLVDGVWRYDLEGIDRAFAAGAGCFLLTNPYNPLGRVFSADELLALSEIVARHSGLVFSDEIWSPLIFSESELVPYATLNDTCAAHTITATSASKAFNLPGLKCAQLITSNPAHREKLSSMGDFAGHGTATHGMIATCAAYNESAPWLADTLNYLQGNRDHLRTLVEQELPGVKYIAPAGTYVAWLDFTATEIQNPAQFFREKAGVALTDGGLCGAAGAGSARLIFATPRPILREILQRMGAALREG